MVLLDQGARWFVVPLPRDRQLLLLLMNTLIPQLKVRSEATHFDFLELGSSGALSSCMMKVAFRLLVQMGWDLQSVSVAVLG